MRESEGHDSDEEGFESIPWDALVTDDAERRRRIVALIALAVGVAGVAYLGVAMLSGDAADPVVAAATSTSAQPMTSLTDAPTTVSEQTLIADDRADVAAAYAAWFASDFFTLDGSDITRSAVRSRLPEGVSLPTVPDRARSFVESAVPVSVQPSADGGYDVVVVVRSLAAEDGESYSRQSAKAVRLRVELGDAGFSVADLPSPVPLPDAEPGVLEVAESSPPSGVIDAARDRAAAWGSVDEAVVSAGSIDGVWRIVLDVVDDGGMRWPVAVWVDESGTIVVGS